MELNLSNYSFHAFEEGASTFEIQAQNLISDFVMEIDKKIVLALFLFGISYFLSLIVLPRSIMGIEYLKKSFNIPVVDIVLNHLNMALKWLISLFETFCLGSCIFVLYIAWIQGLLLPYMKIVIVGLICVLFLIFLLKTYNWVANKHYKKTIKKLEVINDG